jgi:hypothetical protein
MTYPRLVIVFYPCGTNDICNGIVREVKKYIVHLDNPGAQIHLDFVHKSENDLIDSQIEYWNKLKYPTIEESTQLGNEKALHLMDKIIDCQKRIDFLYQSVIKECQHEYKKTPGKSGMIFINMCHKCQDQQPYLECEHKNDVLLCDHQYINISESMAYCIKCKNELNKCQHERHLDSIQFNELPCTKCGRFHA